MKNHIMVAVSYLNSGDTQQAKDYLSGVLDNLNRNPMSHFQHLTITERESLREMKIKGVSLRKIAAKLARNVVLCSNFSHKS